MEIETTPIQGVWVIVPKVFDDPRGYFMETFQQQRFADNNLPSRFVQDNFSYSTRYTLRGLHYQNPRGQAKLVQAVLGEIFDVVVDIRVGSPTFGQWFGIRLSDTNHNQMLVDAGLAHGFCVLSAEACVAYKCTDFYAPDSEGGILWSDPDIGIEWPVDDPLLSDKDKIYHRLKDIDRHKLPKWD